MALRMLEVMVPPQEVHGLKSLIQDLRVVHVWSTGSELAEPLTRILVEAQDTEALTDRLVSRFGSRSEFRITLLPVEATLPAVEAPTPSETEAAASTGRLRRISREELYEDLSQAATVTPVYIIMVALSTVVAAVGLLRDDVAIVIGAMVIAPLLGPNIALSLAATLGDPVLARRSLRAIVVGVIMAAVASIAVGLLLPVDAAGPQIAARTQPDVGDVILALAAGAAGSLAFTTGVPAVVVGVMVAVALLPPLVVSGLLAGAGQTGPALGALVLVLTNVICVNLAAVGMFLLQKVRPRTWWEASRARRATLMAVATWIAMLSILVALMLSGRIDSF